MNLYRSDNPSGKGWIALYARSNTEAQQLASAYWNAPAGVKKTTQETMQERFTITDGELRTLRSEALSLGRFRIAQLTENEDYQEDEF